ncbi:MAG: carbohydrate kinase family protein [Bacteroidales bacterium]|nr:carbohydrate kinase family protein [Bacteroidales bacterium]
MEKYDAVIAGYTCVDMIPDFKNIGSLDSLSDLLKPGKLIEIGDLHFVLGGVVPNTGLAMKKFNKRVFLNGLIGDDFIGKIAKEWLGNYGVSEGVTTTKEAGSAFSIVIAPPGVDRIFLESPGCNQIFDSSYINFDVIAQSRLFHFGYPPLLKQFFLNGGSQLSQMFSKVQQMNVLTSLDFSLPDPESESGKVNWPEIMQKTLPFIDIFVPSLEEVFQIMQPGEYDQILSSPVSTDIIDQVLVNSIRKIGKQIIDCGVKILLIKAGTRGAYLLTGDVSSISERLGFDLQKKNWNCREFWCNAYPADNLKIVNASGAGDTAIAAFLSTILDGESPDLALKYAALAGRNSLYCHNIYRDLSDWQTMAKEIKSETNEIIFF